MEIGAQEININVELECNNGETQCANGTRANLRYLIETTEQMETERGFQGGFLFEKGDSLQTCHSCFFKYFFYFQPAWLPMHFVIKPSERASPFSYLSLFHSAVL